MLSDGSCQIPCYQEESECNLTLVKIFLAKHSHSKTDPPDLVPLQSIMWHGERTNKRETEDMDVVMLIIQVMVHPGIEQIKRLNSNTFISLSSSPSRSPVPWDGLFPYRYSPSTFTFVRIGLFTPSSSFETVFSFSYIRMSSPLLNNLILAGCMLAYLSIIFMGINSSLFNSSVLMNVICPVSERESSTRHQRLFRHVSGCCLWVSPWRSARCSARLGVSIRSSRLFTPRRG